MAKVTIKVRNGEVTVPVIAKVVKDNKIVRLTKVIGEGSDAKITYVYPTACGGGTCDASAWTVEELATAQPCSVEFWNLTVQSAALAEVAKISQFTKDFVINE